MAEEKTISNYRKETNFEKICKIFGFKKFPVPSNIEKKMREEIEFCHFEIEPSQVFSASIFISAIVFVAFSTILFILNLLTMDLIFSLFILSLILFYFMVNYVHFITIYYRAKFSSEMTLSIIYMTVSLQSSKNLERAVSFAASNLTGLLGLDFKRAIWNVQTGKSYSISDELSKIAEKWRAESQEFVDAISILKSSTILSETEFNENIKKAVEIVLDGTKKRMKDYAMELKVPLNLVNSFGILLPLIAMTFLPVAGIIIPEIIKGTSISIIYVIVLPLIVYFLFKQYFYTRPYSYHQIEISNLKFYENRKRKVLILLSLFSSFIFSLLLYFIMNSDLLSDTSFLLSLLATNTIGYSVVLFGLLMTIGFENVNKKFIKYEEELPTAIMQLSSMAKTGKPIEKLIEELPVSIRDLEIKELFIEASKKMKYFGLSLNKAFFDEKLGVLRDVPSKLIKIVIKSLIDLADKSSYIISKTLESSAKFLNDAKDVNKFTDEILNDITSEMKVTVLIFAPLTAGIIVGLISMIVLTFSSFGESLTGLKEIFKGREYSSAFESFSWLLNINKNLPLPYFQIVVGLYMIEVVSMISYFLGELKYGEDEISKIKDTSKYLLKSLLIYTFVSLGLYYTMKVILSIYTIH